MRFLGMVACLAGGMILAHPANAFLSAPRGAGDAYDKHREDQADRPAPDRVPNWDGKKQSQQGPAGRVSNPAAVSNPNAIGRGSAGR